MAAAVVHAGNSGSVPGKIVIRGTSKLSLKDRFAKLSNELLQQEKVSRSNDVSMSTANRLLAQDLENRPEIVAALSFQRKPVQQRLGVKARLGVSNGFQQRNPGFRQFRNRYRNFNGGQYGYFNNGFRRPRNFGPKRMDNNRFGSYGGVGFGRGSFRKRFRGGGGGWRYGRGGNRGVGNRNERLSRDELDRQLDEYMSKTKVHLDNDLDIYMGETVVG